MDGEENVNDNQTSNRILLAVLITFISIPLSLVIEDNFNSSLSFMGPRFQLALVFVPAIFTDRIYVHYIKRKKHITRRSSRTNNP